MRLKDRVFFLAFATAVAAGLLAPAREVRASATVSIGFFYDSLAPYGDWVTVPTYGRCWRPARVAFGWQPYLDGEWDYTDAGWTWVSFDPWGGDPYHYGTWVFTASYGWVWIPGTVWAPAWVTWCITDDAYGWAPVPPSFAVGTAGYVGPAMTGLEARVRVRPGRGSSRASAWTGPSARRPERDARRASLVR